MKQQFNKTLVSSSLMVTRKMLDRLSRASFIKTVKFLKKTLSARAKECYPSYLSFKNYTSLKILAGDKRSRIFSLTVSYEEKKVLL